MEMADLNELLEYDEQLSILSFCTLKCIRYACMLWPKKWLKFMILCSSTIFIQFWPRYALPETFTIPKDSMLRAYLGGPSPCQKLLMSKVVQNKRKVVQEEGDDGTSITSGNSWQLCRQLLKKNPSLTPPPVCYHMLKVLHSTHIKQSC